MNAKELIDAINRKNLSPVNVIVGEEQYQIQKIKEAYLALIPEGEREFNVGQYDMETTPLSTALDDAMSVPFFGDYRLVFINDPYFLTGENKKTKVEHDLDGLINYVKGPQPTTILVIIAPYPKLDQRKKVVKALKKYGKIIDNQLMSEKDVRSELEKQLEEAQVKIDPQAMQLFLERTDSKIEIANNELQKLILASGDKKVITLEHVKELVASTLEQNVFDLVDLVMNHQIAQAVQMYHDLLVQREEPLKINAILLGQFRLLLQVKILRKHGYDQGTIAGTLKVHPYRVKLALRKINSFKLDDLRDGYLGLLRNEEKMKSTSQDPELLFQLFLLDFDKGTAR